MKLALVPVGGIVRIYRIQNRVVSCLAERAVGAVTAVKGVKESIEEAFCTLSVLAIGNIDIVGLEEGDLLRIDDRVCQLEVQVRFAASLRNRNWGLGAVDRG